jgi:hypothetical protein
LLGFVFCHDFFLPYLAAIGLRLLVAHLAC